jgi:hypothetical protein
LQCSIVYVESEALELRPQQRPISHSGLAPLSSISGHNSPSYSGPVKIRVVEESSVPEDPVRVGATGGTLSLGVFFLRASGSVLALGQ